MIEGTLYQPGNNPPPTRPQPVYQPGPSFTPSQPPPVFAPAHQAPRQRNWIAQHKVLSGIGGIGGIGFSVIIGAIAGLATLGGSGSSGSSLGSSGSLPGGISGSSCKLVWQAYTPGGSTKDFSTYKAAYNSTNAYDEAQGYGDVAQDADPNSMPGQVPVISVTADSTIDVSSATVAFYSKSGTEVESDSFNVNETLTAGQSATENETLTVYSSVNETTWQSTTNVASCVVVSWS